MNNMTEISRIKSAPGYNSLPMIQNIGKRLVCAYSCGTAHSITEPCRSVFAKYSDDGGKTWSEESLVVNSPLHADVPIGKGLDGNGDLLLWVRCCGETCFHAVCRILFRCCARYGSVCRRRGQL